MKAKKLIYFVTEDWYFCLHWLRVAEAAKLEGFDVSVITRIREHGEIIRRSGLAIIPFEISRQGMNPFQELLTIARLVALYRRHAPDIVHNIAMKPTLYGSLAARLSGVDHLVCTLAGLGWLFTSPTLIARFLSKVVSRVFGICFKTTTLAVQNSDDASFMRALGLRSLKVIRGAGVDTQKFQPQPEMEGPPLVILPARMLWDKGVAEFVAAARLLRDRSIAARFALVGGSDPSNPAAVSQEQLEAWNKEGAVECWGQRTDMPDVYRQAHIICLPSYREGLPTVLIEAAAGSRPVVTTDTVGCREVVRDGENGFLVPVKSVVELAEALQLLIVDVDLRKKMGAKGREIAVREFAIEKVTAETIAMYVELLAS